MCRVRGILPRVRQFFKSLPLTATPVFSLTHRAASDWVRAAAPHALQIEPCAAFGTHRIPRGMGGVDRRAHRFPIIPQRVQAVGAYADKTALVGPRGGGFDLFRQSDQVGV